MLKKGEDKKVQEKKFEPGLSEPFSNEVHSQTTSAMKCEEFEQIDSNQLREKVEHLNDTVQELEEELDQKSNELNAKNEHLRRNAGIMRNMHHRIQQKELKIEEMTSKVEDLEKRVEAMEEFEKSLVKTMVNLDMKEIMEVVKEQRERILGLETKLREKEKEFEQAEALLEDKHFEKEEEIVTPAVLRLRGINVTLAREDEVKEATKTIEGVETARRMENGGGKPSAPLASVLRANTGLIIQRPAGGGEQRRESHGESDDESNGPSISEQPGPSSEDMARGGTY